MFVVNDHPLPRAGVYQLFNLENGKRYFGISNNLRKRMRDHAGGGSPPKLRAAINKYGAERFEFIPVYYSFGDTKHLLAIESELIREYDTISSGYNLLASHRGGPAGDEYRAIQKVAQNRPERKAQQREAALKLWTDPKTAPKMRAGLERAREASIAPEVLAKISERTRAQWKDPDMKARMSAAISAAASSPETIAKHGTPEERKAFMRGIRKFLTDDPEAWARWKESQRKSVQRPEVRAAIGKQSLQRWGESEFREKQTVSRLARWAKPGQREAASAAMMGRRFANEGIKSIRLMPNEPLPDGWAYGRLRKLKGQ